MAELVVIVATYVERVPMNPWPVADTTQDVQVSYPAEWIGLDDRHVWQLVIGDALVWLGPYWTDEALQAAGG